MKMFKSWTAIDYKKKYEKKCRVRGMSMYQDVLKYEEEHAVKPTIKNK